MMRLGIVILFTAATVLTGCDKSGVPGEIKDVAWYRAHPEQRKSTLANCSNNPGELQETPTCINAEQATLLEMSGPSKADYSKAFK